MTASLGNFQNGAFGSNLDGFVYPQFLFDPLRPPTSQDIFPAGTRWLDNSVNPKVIYETTGGGVWESGGNAEATTSTFGIVQLATLTELQNGNAPAGAYVPTANDVATVIQSIVVGAVPPANEMQAGIAEIATQVETDAGADDTRIVTPLKLANFVGSGGFPGVFTDLTATGAVSFTGATGALTMTSATASSLGVTGAGVDLTLSSGAGRVVVNGEEAAADAIRLLSAAGGLDTNVALQMNLDSSQAAANAVRIIASAGAGGIDIDAGSGGITVDSTGAISLDGAAASNFSVSGAGIDLTLSSASGSVPISAGEAVANAIGLQASAGGIDANAALQINIDSSQAANDALRIFASAGTGGIDVDAGSGGIAVDTTGAFSIDGAAASNVTVTGAGIDLTLASVLGSVLVSSTENAALAIRLHANGGTSETIQVHSDQGTGVSSIGLLSDVGGITLRSTGFASADAINVESVLGGFDVDAALQINIDSSQAAVNAIRLLASGVAGGVDVDAGTGGITIDTTGLLSLDSAAASNFTVTGAFDLTLSSSAGSVNVSAGEAAADALNFDAVAGGLDVDVALQMNLNSAQAAADAIRIFASNAAGGIDIDSGSGGFTVDTTAQISLDSATASNFTVTGAADLTLASSLGAVNVTSGEANADSINVTSAGGMNIVATGAAAKDTIITNTNGSMTLTAGENVTDAMNFTASGAASRMTLTAGTGSISLQSGIVVKKKDVVFADSPYTVLGTDYFLSVDTSGGAITVTLPNAATLAGRTYVIRDTGGAAAASNITVATGGGNLVGGGASAATKTISAAYAGATVYSNGVTWNYCYVA